jgi:mannose-6-phosphate isomerase class I
LFAYETEADDFALYRAEVGASTVLAELQLPAEAIVLCTGGEVAVSESSGNREVLRRGQAAYLDNSAKSITLAGSGTLFLATGPIA